MSGKSPGVRQRCAIRYFLDEYDALRGYLRDGRYEIDNNPIENPIRPSAVCKKRWLFIGHPNAGWRSAVIYFGHPIENIAVFCETPAMPKEIFFSSYLCDCGHRIDFSENTVDEVKQKSKRKRQWLIETRNDPGKEHVVIFDGGKMIDILCPREGHRPNKPKFTKRQGEYLTFINQYTKVHGVPPAEHEMQRHFCVSSASVHQMIIYLEQKGFIERTPGIPRSIRILVPARDLPQ